MEQEFRAGGDRSGILRSHDQTWVNPSPYWARISLSGIQTEPDMGSVLKQAQIGLILAIGRIKKFM